ncbi:MAG: hypothetical protein ACK4M7_06015, partial [Burkholderiales bacterium]
MDELARLDNDLSKSTSSRGGSSIYLPPNKTSINRSLYQLIHNSQASNESIKFALLSFSNKLYAGKVETEITSDLEKNVATLITNYDSKALSPYQHSFSLLPLEEFLAIIISAVKNRANLNGILANKEEILEQFIHLSIIKDDHTLDSNLILTFLDNLYSALNINIDARRFVNINQADLVDSKRDKILIAFENFAVECFELVDNDVVFQLIQNIEKSLITQIPATENQQYKLNQILFRALVKVAYSLSESKEYDPLILHLIEAKPNSKSFELELRMIWEMHKSTKLEELFNKIEELRIIKGNPQLDAIVSEIQNKLVKYLGLNDTNQAVISLFAQVAPKFEQDSFEHELSKSIVKVWYGGAEAADLIWPIKQVIDGKPTLKELLGEDPQEIKNQANDADLKEKARTIFEQIKKIPQLSEKLEAKITQDFCTFKVGRESFEYSMFQVAMQVWHDADEDCLNLIDSIKQAVFDQDLDKLLECKQQAKDSNIPLLILNMGTSISPKLELSFGNIRLAFSIEELGFTKLMQFIRQNKLGNPKVPQEVKEYIIEKLEKIKQKPTDNNKILSTLPDDLNELTLDHAKELVSQECRLFTDECKSP